MKMTFPATLLLCSAALFSLPAQSAGMVLKAEGGVLTNAHGMTVYTLDKDSAGKSTCNDDCAKAWPPVMATAGDKPHGKMTIVTREDGSKQWAYNGKPVYLFVKDKKAGDQLGNNVKDMWHIVKP